MAKKRLDKNSVTKAKEGFAGAFGGVPLPQGVELRNDDEMVIWDQFSRARVRDDWRDMDLLLLAKVVRQEADIRRYQTDLDGEGVTLLNQRGTRVVNPLLNVIDTLQRQQLSVIRSMSLNQTPNDPRTLAGSAKNEEKARNAIKNGKTSGLLAGTFTPQ